jgi:hypothetical protein
MKAIVKVILFSMILLLAVPATSQQTHRLPSATEVFNLRTKCYELGAKQLRYYLAGRYLDRVISSDYTTCYNEKTNRCYVSIYIVTMDEAKLIVYYRWLVDCQTGEGLASTMWQPNGISFGMVEHNVSGLERFKYNYQTTERYIDSTMHN